MSVMQPLSYRMIEELYCSLPEVRGWKRMYTNKRTFRYITSRLINPEAGRLVTQMRRFNDSEIMPESAQLPDGMVTFASPLADRKTGVIPPTWSISVWGSIPEDFR